MSEQLLPFEQITYNCEYIDIDSEDLCPICNHPENKDDNDCRSSICPFCRMASLADLKRLDPEYLYQEYWIDFEREIAQGENEDEMLCADVGEEWVIVEDDNDDEQ